MAEQLRLGLSTDKGERPQPRLLRGPVLIEGATELSKTPFAQINKFHWFARELEIRRGDTSSDTIESGLSFQAVASEFLTEPKRVSSAHWEGRFILISHRFGRGRITRRDFASMLTFKDVIKPTDSAMAECLRHSQSLTLHFHNYWNELKRLYTDAEWPESD